MGSSVSKSYSNLSNSVDNTMNQLIFHPPKTEPADFYQLTNDHNDIFFIKKDNISVCVNRIMPVGRSLTKYFIFSHGNASDICNMNGWLQAVCNKMGVGCISYDYPGYGLSKGDLSEDNCYSSLEAVVEWAINDFKIDPKNLILVGQSLGTGVTVDYAANHDWHSPIILISPYKTIIRVVMDNSTATSSSFIDKFKSQNKIKDLKCPVKIFHGEQDNLINIGHGKELYELLPNKSLNPVWIPEADHNNILNYILTDEYLKEFFVPFNF